MIRKAIIVGMTVLAATVFTICGRIAFGGVAWSLQPNDTYMGAFICGDRRFLEIGFVRIVREYVKPETVESLDPQQFKRKPITILPGLWVTFEDSVCFFGTQRTMHGLERGSARATVYHVLMHRGDAVRQTVLVVHRHWLWGSALGLAAYPTIAFIRGPWRRWRRKKKGLCLSCGYDEITWQ